MQASHDNRVLELQYLNGVRATIYEWFLFLVYYD